MVSIAAGGRQRTEVPVVYRVRRCGADGLGHGRATRMTHPTIDATQRSISTCSLRRLAALRCFVLRRAIRHNLPFFTTSGNSDEGASGVEASMWVGAGSLGTGLVLPCANAVEQRTIARTICLNMQTPYTFPRLLSRETRGAHAGVITVGRTGCTGPASSMATHAWPVVGYWRAYV